MLDKLTLLFSDIHSSLKITDTNKEKNIIPKIKKAVNNFPLRLFIKINLFNFKYNNNLAAKLNLFKIN